MPPLGVTRAAQGKCLQLHTVGAGADSTAWVFGSPDIPQNGIGNFTELSVRWTGKAWQRVPLPGAANTTIDAITRIPHDTADLALNGKTWS